MIDRSILIIDDERRMADSLRDLLASARYDAVTAYSGVEGVALMETRAFPVVLTDLRMQGMDGIEVVRHVAERHPRTLVIVLTGHASTETAIDALHYHAFDYLRKPVDFDHLRGTVERAFQRAELDQIRDDTAAMITHDIKAPLTSILGFAALVYDRREGAFHPKAPDYLEIIRANGQKLLAMIDNFLTSCKVESGRLTVHPRRVNVAAFALDLTEMFSGEAERRGLRIESDLAAAPETAEFDEGLLFRAAGNLLQNAIKYADAAEPITLRVRLGEADQATGRPAPFCLEVQNLAPNLLPHELEGLFVRFKRANMSAGIEGSGIGLYVVDLVAAAHGGRASARMEEGDRVTFTIEIPPPEAADPTPVG